MINKMLMEATINNEVLWQLKHYIEIFHVELLKEIAINYRSAFYDIWGHKEE